MCGKNIHRKKEGSICRRIEEKDTKECRNANQILYMSEIHWQKKNINDFTQYVLTDSEGKEQ